MRGSSLGSNSDWPVQRASSSPDRIWSRSRSPDPGAPIPILAATLLPSRITPSARSPIDPRGGPGRNDLIYRIRPDAFSKKENLRIKNFLTLGELFGPSKQARARIRLLRAELEKPQVEAHSQMVEVRVVRQAVPVDSGMAALRFSQMPQSLASIGRREGAPRVEVQARG